MPDLPLALQFAWLIPALPFAALSMRRDGVLRHAARAGAALLAWRHLRRPHCFEPAR